MIIQSSIIIVKMIIQSKFLLKLLCPQAYSSDDLCDLEQ